jgi:hypothetical protein
VTPGNESSERTKDLESEGAVAVSPLSTLQLFRIFAVDRLREQVTKNPDFVNTARLKTLLEALEVIRHTPLISVAEADYLIQTSAQDIGKADLVSQPKRRTEAFQHDVDFGVISTFIDLTSDLVTDDKIHAFFRRINQRGAKSLYGDLARRRGAQDTVIRKETGDYHIGFSNFLDLAFDFSVFVADAKNQAFQKSILRCLAPWLVPDVELFCSSVEEAVEQALFTNVAGEPDKEEISFIWEAANAKLGAVRDLVERVHQERQPADVPVSAVSEELLRIAGRLSVLASERARLGAQLNELEVAERVLTRFGRVETTERRRRGRPARTAPEPSAARGRARAAQPAQTVSLSDATLRAVQAYGKGATPSEVLSYLTREFGMSVRPNHLGIALQRHRRAGRLETRDSRWFLPHQAAMTA